MVETAAEKGPCQVSPNGKGIVRFFSGLADATKERGHQHSR
jgi:hypothetical protein